jgi:hypothetical protein
MELASTGSGVMCRHSGNIVDNDNRQVGWAQIEHTKLRLICEHHMKRETPTVDEPSLQTTMPLKTSILLIVFALQP